MPPPVQKLRYTPLILVLALLFHAILPFAAFSPSVHPTELMPRSFAFGDKILLCTGEGLKWVKLADLQSGKEKQKPHSGNQCPLCFAARQGMKAEFVPVADSALPSHRVPDVFMAVYASKLVEHLQTTPLNARAPPASFIG